MGENLAKLLTPEKCQEGMKYYLQAFEDGKLLSLASEIGAEETMLADISHLFSVAYSSLWNTSDTWTCRGLEILYRSYEV